MTSRRRYLSTLALLTAGCNSLGGGSESTASPTDGSPASTDDDAGTPTDDATPTGTPAAEVKPISVDHRAVPWAARLPRPVSWAPAAAADGQHVYVALGRNVVGTPDESDGSQGGALVALAAGDGSEAWRESLAAPVADDLSVAGDSLHAVTGYSTGFDGVQQRVRAFATGGEERWATEPRDAWLSVVAAHDGTTFVATGDDAVGAGGETLFAVGADGGASWEREVGDARGATVAGGSLLYGNGGRELAAYALDGGDERWSVAGEALGNQDAAIAVADGLAFTQAPEEADAGYPIVAHSLSDGSEQWTYSVAEGEGNFVPNGAAALDGGGGDGGGDAVVVGTTVGGTVFGLAGDGSEVWRADAGGRPAPGSPLVGDAVYVPTRSGEVVAFDPASGEERWRYDAPGDAVTTRLADSGLFVFPGRNRGTVLAAVAPDGTERWRFDLPSGVSQHAVAGDRLYAVVEGRSLYAFDQSA